MGSIKNSKFIPGVRSTAELAKRLDLSRWTVSRFLNGHPGVHPETAARIQAAIQELGFSPNPLAQGLKNGRTKIVGICLPELEGPYLSQKLDFLRQSLTKEGYQVMVGMTNNSPREEADLLNRFRVLRLEGLILVASRLAPDNLALHRFQETQIPLILLDPVTLPLKGSISVDRSVGMKQAVQHLMQLGHRHVASLGLGEGNRYSDSRRRGIEAAYEERGWDPKEFVRHIELPMTHPSHYECGRLGAPLVWGTPKNRPTALLVCNDRVAIGLLDGLREFGVRVPQDLSVVGYDNMEVSAFMSPQLTTIDAKPDELVRTATEHLLARIRREKITNSSATITTRLVIRKSTAPPPQT